MRDKKLQKLVMAALFAALTAVMTMVVRIPTPTNGYVNLGDCAVLLSGWLLGPVYGGAAAGLGSALADLLGYPLYAPGTLIIKAGMAVAAGLILPARTDNSRRLPAVPMVVGGVAAEVIMVAGYFLFEAVILGLGIGAAAGIPANMVQGAICAVSALAVYALLLKGGALSRF